MATEKSSTVAASRPMVSGAGNSLPTALPSSVPSGQKSATPIPHNQYAALCASGVFCDKPNTTQVIRKGEGTKVVSERADYQAILLATCPPGARRDVYLLMAQPGEERRPHPHPAGSVEHIIITQGKALVGTLDNAHQLEAGDYICYPADEEHLFKALEADTMAVMVSEQN